ncbi:MAG: hypothetical protein ACREP5_07420, partial [Candidatus Binatia bacterium]
MIRNQSLGGHRQLPHGLQVFVLLWAIIPWAVTAAAQILRGHEEAARVVTVGEYRVVDGVVSG